MDSRFNLTASFETYGQVYHWKTSLNWTPNDWPIDDRIVDFFKRSHDEAYAKSGTERLRLEELSELKRLRKKYPDA